MEVRGIGERRLHIENFGRRPSGVLALGIRNAHRDNYFAADKLAHRDHGRYGPGFAGVGTSTRVALFTQSAMLKPLL